MTNFQKISNDKMFNNVPCRIGKLALSASLDIGNWKLGILGVNRSKKTQRANLLHINKFI